MGEVGRVCVRGGRGECRERGSGPDDATPLSSSPTDEFTTYYGTASPPTSYGGYGGNAKETAK